MKVAVIVGRFQLDSLHAGHQVLLRQAYEECDRVIVLIGTATVRSESNPLKYEMVAQVLQSAPGASVETFQIRDQRYDKDWLEYLVKLVEDLTTSEDDIFFYGSRDSFLEVLPKDYNKVYVKEEEGMSGTLKRSEISYINDRNFRAGYIKAIQDEFKAHYAVVDAIITDGENILLGYKPSGWCIVGGFADDCDSSLEDAVVREVEEETGLKLSNPKYLMSNKCKDWRYKKARQPFSTVFVLNVKDFNGAKAGDDLQDLKVVPLNKVGDFIDKDDSHYMYIQTYINKR